MNSELMQKEKDAIERLKAFEPKDGEPYYLAIQAARIQMLSAFWHSFQVYGTRFITT